MNRLLYNEDGETLDEIVYGESIHVEQMDDHLYWMRVGESHFHFRAEPFIAEDDEGSEVVKVRIRFTLDDESLGDFPLSQRHRTDPETHEWIEADMAQASAYITLRGNDPA